MGTTFTVTWPALDNKAICDAQNRTSAGTLELNGTINATKNGKPFYQPIYFNGFSRTVMLTSDDNLSTVQFTVTGTLNGFDATETITNGPNNNSIETDNFFDTITSISCSATMGASTLDVGYGKSGYSRFCIIDNLRPFSFFSVQGIVVTGNQAGNNVTYSFEITNVDVSDIYDNDLGTLKNTKYGILDTSINAEDDTTITYFNGPVRYGRFFISDMDDNASFIGIVQKQGV